MTVVDQPLVAETSVSSVGGSVFGDAFMWCPADDPRGFDPVTDIAFGDVGPIGVEWIDALVEHCAQGLSMLEALDPCGFDATTTMAWAKGVEQLRRQAAAAAGIAVADHLDAAQPFKDLRFFTAKNWMKHHLQLSGAEAYARVQEAKLRRAVQVWNNALAGGQVGVAQTRLMARIAANPRIEPDVLTAGVWQLMADAMDVSYIEFERRALIWEALADPDGAADKTERNRQRRHAMMRQNADGGWTLHACFDEVGGPEFLETFSWFVDREFNTDWAAATKEHGDGNVDVTTLRRTEAQRRGDALVEMARAAAACPPDMKRPLPTVNFILDATTAAAAADGKLLDSLDYRDVVSRTDRGNRVNPNAIIGVSLWALIRRVVIDSKSVVIDLGRTQRLFTGHARDAVTAPHSVPATTTSKNSASPSPEMGTATGTSPHPTAPPSAELPGSGSDPGGSHITSTSECCGTDVMWSANVHVRRPRSKVPIAVDRERNGAAVDMTAPTSVHPRPDVRTHFVRRSRVVGNSSRRVRRRREMRVRLRDAIVIGLALAACTDPDSSETAPTTMGPALTSTQPISEANPAANSPVAASTLALRIEPDAAAPGGVVHLKGVVDAPDDDVYTGASAGLERLLGADWVAEWVLIETRVDLPPVSLPGEAVIPSGGISFGSPLAFELPGELEPGAYRVCVHVFPADVCVCAPLTIGG